MMLFQSLTLFLQNNGGLKRLLFIGLLVFLSLVFGGVAIINMVSYLFLSKDKQQAVIYQIPEQTTLNNLKPYNGPPPWRLTRQAETFNFPIKSGEIGPVNSLFSAPLQYPFYCQKYQPEFGQVLVDNQQGYGIAVYRRDIENISDATEEDIIGYSKDCSLPTQIHYYYKPKAKDILKPIKQANNDIAKIEIDGKMIDFIVRVEIGTINRFVYMIMALKGMNDKPEKIDTSSWNKRLIYYFRGGVGIGHQQGKANIQKAFQLFSQPLAEGYAIVHSTGNQTSNHYNIQLQEDTALRVKKQFVSRYGKPLYTVGVGGSGGAIQQYLLAQNNPEILDAAIPLYSYPDMVTQISYVFDCELLEYYFDEIDSKNSLWQKHENRSLIEGLNADSNRDNRFYELDNWAHLASFRWPNWKTKGLTECAASWRGLTSLIHNPKVMKKARYYSEKVKQKTHWSYWQDLANVYGHSKSGYARDPWDNVGVQYGLKALIEHKIPISQFLKINANIGGWKKPEDMTQVRYWHVAGDAAPSKFSLWSHHNMLLSPDKGQTPAKRNTGDLQAMQAAYLSGNVFMGNIDIPIIDLRHYLEDKLDMHHLSASFASRQRIINARGNADNQLIWVTRRPDMPILKALKVLEQWLSAMNTTGLAADKVKPGAAIDSCFDGSGRILASGADVWDGDWNNKPQGECLKIYPSYSNSRIVSGAPIAGDLFKCRLQTIEQAINNGVYADLDMKQYIKKLKNIFPEGVCDYRFPDLGRPEMSLDNIQAKN